MTTNLEIESGDLLFRNLDGQIFDTLIVIVPFFDQLSLAETDKRALVYSFAGKCIMRYLYYWINSDCMVKCGKN